MGDEDIRFNEWVTFADGSRARLGLPGHYSTNHADEGSFRDPDSIFEMGIRDDSFLGEPEIRLQDYEFHPYFHTLNVTWSRNMEDELIDELINNSMVNVTCSRNMEEALIDELINNSIEEVKNGIERNGKKYRSNTRKHRVVRI